MFTCDNDYMNAVDSFIQDMEAQSVEVSALGLHRAERACVVQDRSLILSLCNIQLFRISADFTSLFYDCYLYT